MRIQPSKPAMPFYLDNMAPCQLKGQHASRSAAAGTSLSHPSKTSSEPLKPAVSSDTSLTMDGSAMSTSPAPTSIYTPPDSASQPQSNDLPIVPAITPALSVGGAILMLTGPFYALVGIKNKWLHVFLSAAYLTSLAVTVLIIYVMHPPVSNAVQGAYLVAACMTGLIFGGGSLIFADITEALACLLGGFSLAMWFLVLVPGGLIRSTAGKAIFIGCFTLGSFGFYTSHWTRAYAIIGSTAFAGATVIVLGIDCFSRAGLKEFWLYIWHLNNNMFPLHYNGIYPITRGIRVEIAAIIICFLIGVMSQMKIWKVVKRRREEKATERLRHEKLQEEAEVAIGKEIEERNAQNRVLWESAYNSRHGNDRHVDSGISMTITNPRKGLSSTNILSQGVVSRASIELKELEGDDNITEGTSKSGPKDKTRAIVTVAVASDDENLGITSAPASVLNENQSLSPVEIGPSQESDPSLVKTEEVETDRLSSAPNAVPLPFEIPSSDSNADRRSSIAASLASDHFSTRVLNRLSGGSPRRASSQRSQRSYTAISTSEEAVMIPHDDEDDGTSSVAANVDEISDGQHSDADKTTSGILAPPDAEENKVRKSSPSIEAQPTDRPGHELSKDQASSPSAIGMDAEAPQAFIAKHEPIAGGEPSGLAKTPEDVLSCKEGQRSSSPTNSIEAKTPPASESAKAEPALRDRLADLSGTSKVMMVYRTNEWAKHLEDAEKPTMDDWIAEHSAVAIPTEKPAPINISALQQTALNASPAPVTPPPNLTQPPPITKPKHQSAYPNQQGPPNPYPSLQRKSSANPSFDRHPSHSSLNSLPSQRATRPPHPHRTSHPPLPIEEDVPSTTKHNRHSTPPNPQALSNPYP
ncbi:MAG: hypothetical protein LQ350_004810, partial [Teloschistes chrysophthalmus]